MGYVHYSRFPLYRVCGLLLIVREFPFLQVTEYEIFSPFSPTRRGLKLELVSLSLSVTHHPYTHTL